ncbi:transcriptional regulator [Natronoarchaeum philippinense]|uniref:Transcriptional regulator n=1 Tax=Natronoarchaeum philippinense TaxID=558529 RepID=A0A285P2C4_NATPI|nr:TrmB family transcriptional regulator sugar-binding domain-containing protein [Natronoarchaeum philippinense]SNZ15889.1 transcriptional regulator [Natronoarchaeum philippinense]
MDERGLTDLLSQFGLSEKEIDTYLAILDRGEAKASDIAADADVSKRYVYSISEELEERGFVEVNDHSVPTMIKARPPSEVIDRLSGTIETIEPELEQRYTSTDEEIEQFEVIKSRPTVLKRIETLLESAEEEVTMTLPASLLSQIQPTLRETVDRGVLVLLLLSGPEAENYPIEQLDGVASAVRVWHARAPLMLTVDRSLGLIAPNDMLTQSNSESNAISLAQRQLVPVLTGSFLGNYWPVAEELYVDRARELPLTTSDFRNAVLQVALRKQQGDDIVATVRGRPVATENGEDTIEGEVVGVRQGLVKPATNSFPVENAFTVDTGNQRFTVGGEGAFVEDYEAHEVILERSEDAE